MRSLLHAFRKHLPDEPRREIQQLLAELGEELGPARDFDEWVDLLQSVPVHSVMAESRLFPAFLRHHQQRRDLVHATVRRCLRGPHFASQRLKINRLLRVELPWLIKTELSGRLPKFAVAQVDKALNRVWKRARLHHSTSPKKLHQLRITLRKARYQAEFFAPALGINTARLAKQLHRVERVLGRIHDVDMAMEHLAHEGPRSPRPLVAYLEQQRAHRLKKLRKIWQRLEDPALERAVHREWASAHVAPDA